MSQQSLRQEWFRRTGLSSGPYTEDIINAAKARGLAAPFTVSEGLLYLASYETASGLTNLPGALHDWSQQLDGPPTNWSSAGDLAIAKPVFALDFSDSSSIVIEDTNKIASITNAGVTFTATGTARPTLLTSGLNGLDVAEFDGAANVMSNGTAHLVTDQLTFFAVVEDDRGTGDFVAAQILAAWHGSTAQRFLFGRRFNYVSESATEALDAFRNAQPTPLQSTWSVRTMAWADNEKTTAYLDGALDAEATNATPSMASGVNPTWNLGGRSSDAVGFWDGRIAEVRVYDQRLDAATIAAISAELQAKWGLV